MTDLLFARSQMALSLGFHIIFAAIGVAMPALMASAHRAWIKTRDPVYKDLTKTWSKGVAIFFAVGAVSGTALSFELGLLWPTFMEHAGPIIGLPFSYEGAAFFLEAIALGLFLYGWDRLPERIHWWTGVLVCVSGVASAFFVIAANAWMNSPTGFDWVNGHAENIDPVAAMFNDAALGMGIHMVLAAFAAVGFAVAGLHAALLLKKPGHRLHRAALHTALPWAIASALIIPITGDLLAKDVAVRQPAKLAAMEAHFHTEEGAGLYVGGIPDVETQTVKYGVQIPKALSFLAFGDFNAEVKGLDAVPRELWPPVAITHLAFQIMVGAGSAMALLALIALVRFRRRKTAWEEPWFLRCLMVATPLGMIAIEAGWTVTEVGRQPWIVYGIIKTADAVTPMPGLAIPFAVFAAIYLLLAALVVFLLRRQIKALHARGEYVD